MRRGSTSWALVSEVGISCAEGTQVCLVEKKELAMAHLSCLEAHQKHGIRIFFRMFGCSRYIRPAVKDILQGVSAKVDNEPCCDWVGEDGAGHYVKMVRTISIRAY